MNLLVQQLINGLIIGCVYAIFAVGFALAFAIQGVLNLAYGAYATVGALLALWLHSAWAMPFYGAVPLAILGTVLLSMAVDQVAFQPFRKSAHALLGPIITSIGVLLIIREVTRIATDAQPLQYSQSFFPQRIIHAGSYRIPATGILAVGLALLIVIGLHIVIRHTILGAAMRAVGADSMSATVAGLSPRRTTIYTAAIGGALAAIAGVTAGLSLSNVSFTLGDSLLLVGFAAVVLGGFGDIRGAFAGALTLGIVDILGAQYISTAFRDVITYGVVFAILVLRPRGLFGEVRYGAER